MGTIIKNGVAITHLRPQDGGSSVIPNDPSPATAILNKLKIDGTNFSIEGNSAKAYNNISAMVTALNAMGAEDLKIGNNIYISTLGVPDLWVRDVKSASVPYDYITDELFMTDLKNMGEAGLRIGYYRVCALEAEKVVVPVQDIQVDEESIVENGVAKFVSEEWTATLTDGTTVTKKVLLSDD